MIPIEGIPADLLKNLDDPMWRLSNLYKIVVKGDNDDDDDPGLVVTFKPNRVQRRLLAKLHNRNLVLKARQVGITTLICILWLDTALFSKDPMCCGIIAQDREAAESIFNGKVKFAYDNLPESLKAAFPLKKCNSSKMEFAHNDSSIRVATSMRSGTIHRLHISEFGKICAQYPEKAKEVITGSIPSVPKSGICVIESTAEGQDGDFYDMTQRAIALQEQAKTLTEKDFKFHFFPWWDMPEYRIDAAHVVFTEADNKYFHETEAVIGRKLDIKQRAWYVATRESDFTGDAEVMWQEYPSYPAEAFKVSTEGCWYNEQLTNARKGGRIITGVPILQVPTNTFWDIGRSDMTSIWAHQFYMTQHRFLYYYENSGEDLIHYVEKLQEYGKENRIVWGIHYLPHEADDKRIGKTPDSNQTIKDMLEELWPGQRFEIVPRVTVLLSGIQATRKAFPQAVIDEKGCAKGLKRVSNYRKRWNKTLGCWSDQDVSDDNAHGADAFRQWGQVVESGESFTYTPNVSKQFKRRGSPMAV